MRQEDLQHLFINEIKEGENLIITGDPERSVQHFVNAIVLCREPSKLIAILQQNLPLPIFSMVLIEIDALMVIN